MRRTRNSRSARLRFAALATALALGAALGACSPGAPSAPSPGEPPVPESDEDAYARARSEIDASDPTIDESRTMGVPLIAEMLGGTIIEEQTDQP